MCISSVQATVSSSVWRFSIESGILNAPFWFLIFALSSLHYVKSPNFHFSVSQVINFGMNLSSFKPQLSPCLSLPVSSSVVLLLFLIVAFSHLRLLSAHPIGGIQSKYVARILHTRLSSQRITKLNHMLSAREWNVAVALCEFDNRLLCWRYRIRNSCFPPQSTSAHASVSQPTRRVLHFTPTKHHATVPHRRPMGFRCFSSIMFTRASCAAEKRHEKKINHNTIEKNHFETIVWSRSACSMYMFHDSTCFSTNPTTPKHITRWPYAYVLNSKIKSNRHCSCISSLIRWWCSRCFDCV